MSTSAQSVAHPLTQPLALISGEPASQTALRVPVWLAALLIGGAFFLCDHSWRVSQAVAYSQSSEEMQITAEGGNTLRRLCFLGLAGLGVAFFACAPSQKSQPRWLLALPVIAYLGWAFSSVLWTTEPGMCLRRLIVLFCFVLAAWGTARCFSLPDLCRLAVMMLAPLTLIGVLAELSLGTFRPWSGEYRFAGTLHPNSQGMQVAVLAAAAMALARRASQHKLWFWGLVAIAIVFSVLTKSRTATAALLVSLVGVTTMQSSLTAKVTAALACGFCGVAGLWLLTLVGIDPTTDLKDALLLGRAEESDTLSGRAFIWPEVLYFINRRPWTGYGYESFWTPAHIDTIADVLQWGVREAHNGYLEILLALGWVGLGLALAAVLGAMLEATRLYLRDHDPAYGFPFCVLLFGLLDSVMESGLAMNSNITFLPLCAVLRMAFYTPVSPPAAVVAIPRNP